MNELVTIERFQHYLGVSAETMARLGHRLTQRPMPLSELADLGHACPLGQQFADRWLDIATPPGFVGVRELIGSNLLLDAAADHGLITRQPQARADLMLREYPAIRHIRRKLAADLIAAEPVVPWPGMKAPFSSILLLIPKGVAFVTAGGEDDSVVAALIRCRDTSTGLTVEWACWSPNGFVGHSDGPTAGPDGSSLTRLAWGSVALLAGEPEEVVATGAGARHGFIRNKRDRPQPSWIRPKRHYISEGSSRTGAKGDGPSPRPHWRAGHSHTYKCGPGRKQERIHWLPAIWCSDEGEED